MKEWMRSSAFPRMAVIVLLATTLSLAWSQGTWAQTPRLQTVPTRAPTGTAATASTGSTPAGSSSATSSPTPTAGETGTATAAPTTAGAATARPGAESVQPSTLQFQPTPDLGTTPANYRTIGIAALIVAFVILLGVIALFVWQLRRR